VTVKSNPENVPKAFHSREWIAALDRLGLRWDLDAPSKTDGADNRWNDFSEVDVSICYRDDNLSPTMTRKPPTRLINAWCAGCIPLVGPEPGYLELIRDGVDGVVVHSVDECLEVLQRLRSDQWLVARLEAGGVLRSAEFTVDHVLDQWELTFDRLQTSQNRATRRLGRLAALPVILADAIRLRTRRAFMRVRSH
jgi:hypothetical protein